MTRAAVRILLTGGGSGGPVVPLLAVQSYIKEQNPGAEFLFIGTAHGPERQMVAMHDPSIKFASVPSGKLRRYFSLRNFTAPFEIMAGIARSLYLVAQFKPDVVFGAGAYVSVPVAAAAWMLRRRITIHQQDVLPSMSNQLLALFADRITVSLESSVKDFYSGTGLTNESFSKVVWTGNPFRGELLQPRTDADRTALRRSFGFAEADDSLPLVLITGGGTGALGLNAVVAEAVPELTKLACVIHLTGKGKVLSQPAPRYAARDFIIANMADVLAAADVVVSRAGMSTITELSVLGKPSVIVPMPDSHQESNALLLDYLHAAVVLPQRDLSGDRLVGAIRTLVQDRALAHELSTNIRAITPHDSTARVAEAILSLCRP